MDKEKNKSDLLTDESRDWAEDDDLLDCEALDDHLEEEELTEDIEETDDPWEKEMLRRRREQNSTKYSIW